MEFFANLSQAFSVALEPTNLLFCFFGCVLGTIVGVLPGLGPAASISLLIPLTYYLTAETAIIMLAGLYYGCAYGGSITSILLNIPGEASSVVTCLDGYQMAKNGRAGAALGISAIGSFIAGTLATIVIMIMAPPLSKFALKFGPPELVALVFLGLTLVTYLSTGSMVKALMSTLAGLLLSFVGTDIVTGRARFTFGFYQVSEGLELIAIAMGLFGIGEVLQDLAQPRPPGTVFKTRLRDLMPTKQDFKDSAAPIARGSIFGFFLGLLPGGGAVIASFLSYVTEKRIAKHPETFGTGDIRGVAGPESANNAAAQGGFVPMMSLGIPGNTVIALLMGALIIHGVTPGPRMLIDYPRVFWGVVGSMYIGNLMLVILNLPLIGIWVRLLKVPNYLLFPVILFVCVIGAFTINNNIQDVYLMILFGVIGLLMRKFEYSPAPLILAFILGPKFENTLRQSLIMSGGSFTIFLDRPIALIFFLVAFTLLLSPLILKVFGKKRVAATLKDEDPE